MNCKTLILNVLILTSLLPLALVAQATDSETEPVIIRKQLIAEETVYEEITLSGMTSIYFTPVFVAPFSFNNSIDYNKSHYNTTSILLGGDYRIEYNSYFLKVGLGFYWIKENKYICISESGNDTTYIDTASYVINHTENTQENVSAYYLYATLPLSFGKTFSIGKVHILPEVGVDFSFLLMASGYNGATLEDKLEVTRDFMNSIIPQISAGVTIGYAINDNLWITLCPWFNYALTPPFKSSSSIPAFKLATFGVRAGIIIK